MGSEASQTGSILSLVISLIALAQVWVIEAWKKFRKPVVELYEAPMLEIGYGQMGPSICILGKMRVLHKDIFVTNIKLKLMRKMDQSIHHFNWLLFKSNIIYIDSKQKPPVELATSFLLSPNNPFNFHVFFADDKMRNDASSIANKMVETYRELKAQRTKDILDMTGVDTDKILSHPLFNEAVYEEFRRTKPHIEACMALDRAFYWDPGDYELTIIVETSTPGVRVEKKKRFTISPEESEQLRLNVLFIIRELCDFKEKYHLAHPRYHV